VICESRPRFIALERDCRKFGDVDVDVPLPARSEPMTIVAAVLAVLLLGYLVVALIKPEKF
jgi:K+-transporting ATPase KdpF subunit